MQELTFQETLYASLKTHFGYDQFRPHQEEIIQHVLDRKDALVIMPTGGGKSLCYQIPALISQDPVLVISPLIALMTDQVQALRANGIAACAINSSMDARETQKTYDDVEKGKVRLLYISPEKVLTSRFLSFLRTRKFSLIAIDEAHCVSIWGNDFRPEYADLKKLIDFFPDVPVIALTATADKATQQDIIAQLGLRTPRTFLSSFERSNIHIAVKPAQFRMTQIKTFLETRKGQAGIIYCLSRKSTEEVAEQLRLEGFKADHYHAEVESAQRRKVQEAFQRDELQIVCATIAFGMGIDKSNIRWVIHYNLPKNVESYYQEIGRSGRDGAPAEALMFYSFGDLRVYEKFIRESQANETFKKVQTEKLERIWELSQANSCRTNVILNYFGEYRDTGCGHCDNCSNPPKGFDGTLLAQKALSVCVRTNQETKVADIVDILRASYRQEIKDHQWDKIKTFGAGRDLSRNAWVGYITQMLNLGLFEIDYPRGSKLNLTPLSNEVLFGNKKIVLFEHIEAKETPQEKRKSKAIQFDDALFQRLRDLRTQLAKEYRTPPYIIFSDAILQTIALEKPLTEQQLRQINGIGQFKASEYGERVIEVVRTFIGGQTILKQPKGRTQLETLQLIKSGQSPEEAARTRKLSLQTIYGHLADLYQMGEDLPLEQYIRQHELSLIRNAWLAHGMPTEEKAIKGALPEEIHYGLIRVGLAMLRRDQAKLDEEE